MAVQQFIQQALDHLRGGWRFRWIALAAAAAVCVLGWGVVFMMPDSYQASARVFVDTRTTLSEVTQGISVEPNIETQINRVRQAMLGAPALQRVAEETDLFRGAVTPREKQAVIDRLRKEIVIKGNGTGGSGSVYVIEYQHHDRDLSLRVVDKLLNTFKEGTLGGKRSGAEKAQQFLTAQIADYERRLSEAEGKLAEFKKHNVGLMPGAQGDYFSRLQAETAAMEKAETDLSLAMKQRATLQKQLRGEQPFISNGGERGGNVSGQPTPAGSPGTAQRLAEAQARLDELLLRFTEKHPEVIGLKATIKELEQRQADEIAAARRGDGTAAARVGLAANPVYQQIQLQYNQNEVQITALEADLANRRRDVAELKSLVNTAPNVEAQFAQLNRDYEVTKAQYETLLQRLERTRIGEEAEAKGVVQFETIDPPSAGFDPVAPNRPLLIAFVLVVGLGAGAGLAYVLHLLKPVFFSANQLTEATGLPVLGTVSVTRLEQRRRAQRVNVLRYAGAASSLAVIALLLIAVQHRVLDMAKGFSP